MKKTFLIISLLTSLYSYGQFEWVTHNDSLFLKSGNDSIYDGHYSLFHAFVRLKTAFGNVYDAIDTKAPLALYARVTGSNATTTGQSLVNITGLSIPLAASATYEFEAVLSVSTSAVTTGTAYGVNYSAAGATVEASITGSSTATASKTLRISALNTATTLYLATSAQTGAILIKGGITTGANAGNLTISHLKLSSGTSTVFINSYLKAIRIL